MALLSDKAGEIAKLTDPELVTEPPLVVTSTVPLTALDTVAIICVSVLVVNGEIVVPPIFTEVALDKPVPVIVIVEVVAPHATEEATVVIVGVGIASNLKLSKPT